jgi:hypothetical protein
MLSFSRDTDIMEMENIEKFLKCVRELGVPPQETFQSTTEADLKDVTDHEAVDLYERKNIPQGMY